MGTATNGTSTYRRMKELAATDPRVAARVELADHRVPEEFYDVARDPDCLNNLIQDADSQTEIDRLRGELEAWMKTTRDPMLESFQKRNDPTVREAYVRRLEEESAARGKRRAARRQAGGGAED
jgi:hypothetical protein